MWYSFMSGRCLLFHMYPLVITCASGIYMCSLVFACVPREFQVFLGVFVELS